MKRIITAIILSWIVLTTFELKAQMGLGDPVNFSSLNGAVYNPGTHNGYPSDKWVTDRSDDEYSQQEIENIHASIEENHPGHIILDEATTTYNCHGYTFGLVLHPCGT